VEALRPLVVGLTLESIRDDMAAFWRRMTGDSQLRWIGPEKGAIHLATAAIVNAAWDLYAKAEGKISSLRDTVLSATTSGIWSRCGCLSKMASEKRF